MAAYSHAYSHDFNSEDSLVATATGDEVYIQVQAELATLNINTAPEVKDFRVPGERRYNLNTPTAGNVFTVLANIATSLERQVISRKRVRAAARRLLKEGLL